MGDEGVDAWWNRKAGGGRTPDAAQLLEVSGRTVEMRVVAALQHSSLGVVVVWGSPACAGDFEREVSLFVSVGAAAGGLNVACWVVSSLCLSAASQMECWNGYAVVAFGVCSTHLAAVVRYARARFPRSDSKPAQ